MGEWWGVIVLWGCQDLVLTGFVPVEEFDRRRWVGRCCDQHRWARSLLGAPLYCAHSEICESTRAVLTEWRVLQIRLTPVLLVVILGEGLTILLSLYPPWSAPWQRSFCILNPRHDIAQDSGESGLIVWSVDESGGEGGKMILQTVEEPVLCIIVHAMQYRDGHHLYILHWNRLEEREDVFATSCNLVRCIARRRRFFLHLVIHLVVRILGVFPVWIACISVLWFFGGGFQSAFRNLGGKHLEELSPQPSLPWGIQPWRVMAGGVRRSAPLICGASLTYIGLRRRSQTPFWSCLNYYKDKAVIEIIVNLSRCYLSCAFLYFFSPIERAFASPLFRIKIQVSSPWRIPFVQS